MMQTSISSGEFVDITYTVDDVVNNAGYGKFQIRLLILAGLGWIADSCEIFVLSIIGQLLACEWTIYRGQLAIITNAVFAGFAIGSVVLGIVADKFGRKKALGVSAIILFIVGIGNAFVPSFLWMVVCRAIIGIALGGVNQGLTLCTEYCPINKRGKAGFYLCYFWSLGSCIVILLSWVVMEYLNSWRFLIGLISLPCLLVIISYKWYPESARYYLVSGQYERAVDTLQKLSNMNGVDLPSGRLLHAKTQEKRGDLKNLLCKEYRITSLLLWYIWFASAFSAYGVFFVSPVIIQNGYLGTADNSTLENSFEDSSQVIPCLKFTNQNFIDLLWTSAAEFPGLLVFTFLAEKCRRKVLVSGSCFISSILLLLLLLRTQKIVILLILFASRGIIISVSQLVYIVTLEAYPTTFRSIGIGCGNFFSKVGGITIPYVAQVLVIENPTAAMGLISGIIFLAGIAAVFLPFETKGARMKEVFHQNEEHYIDLGDVSQNDCQASYLKH